jgi:xylitol oxidase
VSPELRNWAGNYAYRAARIHQPESVDALQELVRAASSVRALGSRHSFNAIADTAGDLVSLAGLPRIVEIDTDAPTVTVDGGIRYGDFCQALHDAGLALHNMASLPHISVAGACATATHGSGVRSQSLAAAVVGIELVDADGEIVRVEARDLEGAVVALGALGIVTRLTLRAEPAYRVRQDVFEALPQAAFVERFAEIAALADSVSFFTPWVGPDIDQLWLKRRVTDDGESAPPADVHGATPATIALHPIRGLSAAACTAQLGVPGPWHERVPHFRMDHTPSSGVELQSEYFVAREDSVPAFLALDRLRDRLAPLAQVTEIRTIAADDHWLSPAYGRASTAFHFTWQPDWTGVRALLPAVEAALEPFAPRPHWAKLFTIDPARVRARYERLPDFVELARRLDPAGKFRNAFVDELLFESAPDYQSSRPRDAS